MQMLAARAGVRSRGVTSDVGRVLSRCSLALCVLACVLPGAASASPVHVSFLGQSHSAQAGSAWAYYVRAQQDGKPLQAIMTVQVDTAAGKVVDHVGRFLFTGSWLGAYLWNAKDRGSFLFKVSFSQHGKTVAAQSYRLRIT